MKQVDLAQIARYRDLVQRILQDLQLGQGLLGIAAGGLQDFLPFLIGVGSRQPVGQADAHSRHGVGGHQPLQAGFLAVVGLQRFTQQPVGLPRVAHALQADSQGIGRYQRLQGVGQGSRFFDQRVRGVQRHIKASDLAATQCHAPQQLAALGGVLRPLQAPDRLGCVVQQLGMATQAHQEQAAPIPRLGQTLGVLELARQRIGAQRCRQTDIGMHSGSARLGQAGRQLTPLAFSALRIHG